MEKAEAEKVAAEKAGAEKAAAEKSEAEKTAADKAVAEKAEAEKAPEEKGGNNNPPAGVKRDGAYPRTQRTVVCQHEFIVRCDVLKGHNFD